MADSRIDDATLKSMADHVRAKGGTTALLSIPDGFNAAVDGIKTQKPEQEKTATATDNGTVTVTPDPGKVLSKATVSVNVPSKTPVIKPITIAENGTVTAPAGTDGYSPITVDVPAGGEEAGSIIDRSIVNVSSGVATIGEYSLSHCDHMLSADFQNAIEVRRYAFYLCNKITTLLLPKVNILEAHALHHCDALPKLDLPKCESIENDAFYKNLALVALILRSTKVCSLEMTNAFTGTPIESGTGYIYVPKSLVNQYKSATNWANFKAQIRAIEDYPDITGG